MWERLTAIGPSAVVHSGADYLVVLRAVLDLDHVAVIVFGHLVMAAVMLGIGHIEAERSEADLKAEIRKGLGVNLGAGIGFLSSQLYFLAGTIRTISLGCFRASGSFGSCPK